MNDNEIMNRVNALPERFADRLDPAGLDDVRGAARAGEWGEALEVLLGGLVKTQVRFPRARARNCAGWASGK